MNTDVTSILQLNKGLGRVLLALYGAGTLLVATLNLGNLKAPVLGIIALALMCAALVILTLTSTEPFDLPKSVAVLAITATMAVVSTGNAVNPGAPGYANWHLGAITFLLLVLALRGRRALAWIGFALLSALTISITLVAGLPVLGPINDLARQAGTLAIGTLFALVLRRASRTITAIHDAQIVRSNRAAASYAAIQERTAQTIRLERDARPALERLLIDEPLSDIERAELALLEDALRDSIRAPGFSGERLGSAVREARSRGIRVILVDDRGADINDHDRARAEQSLIDELRMTAAGTVTARLSPPDSGEIALIVVDQYDNQHSVVVRHHSKDVIRA